MNSNRIFDTDVQLVKYKVLKEVIRRAYEGGLDNAYMEIPKLLSPGPKAETRCCIYKERAILQDRIQLALGGDKENPNVIEVIDSACDECPFGAISDKSLVLDIIDILKKSENNTKYKVYAVIAPAIVSQCRFGRVTQVVTAIRKLGFHHVVEAALGADITLYREAKEWEEKKLLTTSCCPSFVSFVEKNFPELTQYISSSVSPMVETARLIKRSDPTAKIVFIGPCTSKKLEYRLEKTGGAIDSVMSFEELQAFLDARGIDTTQMEDSELNNASYYGRIFAKSGGIAHGVADVAKAMGVEGVKPIAMNGIAECKANLMRLKMGKAAENFFEGMACDGGCLNGPVCITHSPRNIVDVDKYGNEAREKTIFNSVKLLESF